MAHLPLNAPAAVVLLVTLAIASAIDLRSREIPNWLVAVAALAGLCLAALANSLVPALLSGVLAGAPFLCVALVRPEGMGMGDVKLAAVLGIFLGQSVWVALAIGLALAGLSGALISLGRRLPPSRIALPLAPFLALGAGVVLLAASGPLQ